MWNLNIHTYLCIFHQILITNNINNCKISIAPISSKRIELSGAPSTRVGQTHSPSTMLSSSINDKME